MAKWYRVTDGTVSELLSSAYLGPQWVSEKTLRELRKKDPRIRVVETKDDRPRKKSRDR